MQSRVFLVGFFGGIVISIALVYPMFVWIPGLYLEEWIPSNQQLVWICSILSGILLLVTGAVASHHSGFVSRRGGTAAGALAGWVAGMLAYAFMFAPAAGVIGSADIFRHGMVPAVDDATYLRLIFDSTHRTIAYTTFVLWGAALLGLGGGALGGILMKPSARKDGSLKEYIIPLAIYALIGSLVNYFFTVSFVAVLSEGMGKVASELDFSVPLTLIYIVPIPLLSILAWVLFWQMVIWIRLREEQHSAAERSLLSQFAGYFGLAAPVFLLLLGLQLDKAHFIEFHLPAGIILLLAGLPAAITAWRRRRLPRVPPASIPSTAWLLRFGILLVGVILMTGYLGPLSSALNLALFPIVTLGCLIPGSTGCFPASVLVQEVYQAHILGLISIALGFSFYVLALAWAFGPGI